MILENVDFIYATPQGPYSFKLNDLAYEWSLWTSPDLKLRKKAANLISDYVSDLVHCLREKYKISDVYLFGFSQGAVMPGSHPNDWIGSYGPMRNVIEYQGYHPPRDGPHLTQYEWATCCSL